MSWPQLTSRTRKLSELATAAPSGSRTRRIELSPAIICSMAQIKTFYDEIGVERCATATEIKHAFKETAKVYHPDKNPEDKQAWAHEQMSRLNFIVETLLNPKTRKEYDELIRKYEEMPLVTRPRRAPREQNAIEREYA